MHPPKLSLNLQGIIFILGESSKLHYTPLFDKIPRDSIALTSMVSAKPYSKQSKVTLLSDIVTTDSANHK